MYDPDIIKVIEVAQAERMLDARSKTAMLSVATWADYYRVGEDWHHLHQWRQWAHGKTVNEVSHFGEYTTVQGDILTVCPVDSDDAICQVQIIEIRMVDFHHLSDHEIRELGYTNRHDYNEYWSSVADGSHRGWFMRFMLLSEVTDVLQ
ncbi:MAG: hypothetical protein JXN59_06535 [Anaerolineae bacterium]|nr:hypothetical protein [Anaerolineae bacterium]